MKVEGGIQSKLVETFVKANKDNAWQESGHRAFFFFLFFSFLSFFFFTVWDWAFHWSWLTEQHKPEPWFCFCYCYSRRSIWKLFRAQIPTHAVPFSYLSTPFKKKKKKQINENTGYVPNKASLMLFWTAIAYLKCVKKPEGSLVCACCLSCKKCFLLQWICL